MRTAFGVPKAMNQRTAYVILIVFRRHTNAPQFYVHTHIASLVFSYVSDKLLPDNIDHHLSESAHSAEHLSVWLPSRYTTVNNMSAAGGTTDQFSALCLSVGIGYDRLDRGSFTDKSLRTQNILKTEHKRSDIARLFEHDRDQQ